MGGRLASARFRSIYGVKYETKMENKTASTAADLALYLGAPAIIEHASPYTFHFFDNGGTYLISGNLLNEVGKGEIIAKPILRPLSDITEEDMEEKDRIFERHVGAKYAMIMATADFCKYLLSRHFDLFGWIESGLAIDKTKK